MKPPFGPNRREAVRRLMKLEARADCDVPSSRWYTQQELMEVGGIRFSAQLFELVREDTSLAYDCRCVDRASGEFVYRLRKRREREAKPVTRRRKVKELAEENDNLRAQLDAYRKAWARLSGEELELLVSAKPVHVGAR